MFLEINTGTSTNDQGIIIIAVISSTKTVLLKTDWVGWTENEFLCNNYYFLFFLNILILKKNKRSWNYGRIIK